MADKSAEKQELRRKLASMKKDYERTLRSVEKSEKAKRARSHVQRKLAEQVQLSSASPSCTHTFSRRTKPTTDEPLQDEKARDGRDESLEEREFKSVVATKRRQRQRRSVSFIIPKETPSERDSPDNGEVEKKESHLGDTAIKKQEEQLESRSKRSSLPELVNSSIPDKSNDIKVSTVLKALLVNDTLGDFKVSTHTRREDRVRSNQNVVLVVPESQFTESVGEGCPERDVTPVTLAVSHPQNNSRIKAEGKLDLDLPSNKFDNDTTKSSSISPLQEATHNPSKNNSNNNTNKMNEKIETTETALKPPQVGIKKRRAGRRSLKSSRKPRELTASDISMKEVVKSQSTEEGSHTWIEGLMYPVEYYVRRTRSMSSSQSSQCQSHSNSQRYMDRNDSQRNMDTQLRTTEQIDSLTDSTRSKDSVPQATTVKAACVNQSEVSRNQLELSQCQIEPCKNLTGASNFPPVSDSDSSRSQLSESLLKTSLPGPQDCPAVNIRDNDQVKLSRQTKPRKLQRRRVILKGSSRASLSKNSTDAQITFTPNHEDSKSSNSGPTASMREPQSSSNTPDLCSGYTTDVSTLDLRLNPDTEDHQRTVSQHELNPGSIFPSLRNLRLPCSDFALPDDHFGTLKEAKLKTLPEAGEVATYTCEDGNKNFRSSLPLEREKVNANTYKSDVIDKSIPAEHHQKNFNEQLVLGLSQTTQGVVVSVTDVVSVTQDDVTPVAHDHPIQKPYQSDKNITENSTPEMLLPLDDINSVKPPLDSRSPARSCIGGKIHPDSFPVVESPDKNVLHSQFSLTQFHDSCSLAFPSAGCTPGLSPSCSRDDIDQVILTKNVSPSLQDVKMAAEGEDLGDRDQKLDSCLDEGGAGSSCLQPSVTSPLEATNRNFRSNQQQHTVFVYPNQTTSSKDGSTDCSTLLKAVSNETGNLSAGDQPTSGVNEGTNSGSITPPTVHPQAVSSNIQQKSPFAGGATGSPFGRAEEPKAMSQCEVEVLSEDNEADERVTGPNLASIGCLKLDLPWEQSPALRDITSGVVNLDEETSILALVYQRTLVFWLYYRGTQEWKMLRAWVIPQDEEFILLKFLSCSKQNEVTLVVAGKFASCAVRILTFDTLTEDFQQLDVILPQSVDAQMPYLLCPTSEQDFIVAVKDVKNKTTVFSVQVSTESRDVHLVELATGSSRELTSLLKVEETAGIVMATTSSSHILLWCLKTGQLLKEVPIKPVTNGSRVSCLEAVAEAGLLFLILVYQEDDSDLEVKCNSNIGAMIAFNPHTDKMLKLMDYNVPNQHKNASLVDGVLYNATLMAKLSDGSLHQLETSTGNLLNFSSGNPTNQSLWSAQLCDSQVVLIGTAQHLEMYNEYS
ncbi:uncharacterized protein [Asterias amurensis]|uniref:uncharacterized protein n=1 Tax=Asterias amurensis TaxID=7602 RepID=UPI003AB6A735